MVVALHAFGGLPLAPRLALAVIAAGTLALAVAAYDAYLSFVADRSAGGGER